MENQHTTIISNSKVWFITGAGRGIGIDLVKEALDSGYFVVATARSVESLIETFGKNENLLPLALDVSDTDSINKAIETTMEKFGRIDVLINNAGRFYTGFFETMSDKQVRSQMEINFFGTLNITRTILPIMRRQRSGQIITISALLGIVGWPFVSVFSASKFALEGWMESLNQEVSQFGIQTMIIEPGAFRTKPSKDQLRTVFPEIHIDDYAEETKKRSESIKAFYGHEPGNRHKLANAIRVIIDMENPPKRFVAGSDAVDGIIAKGKQLIDDANAFFELSTGLGN